MQKSEQSPCLGRDLGKQPAESHHNQRSRCLAAVRAFGQALESVVAEGW